MTPGTSGAARVFCDARDSFPQRTITSAFSFAAPAGSKVFIEAIRADATYTDGLLSAAQAVAVAALVDGTGIQVAPQFLGVYGGVVFDAGSGNVMPTMRVVVNAADDVVAASQIASGGAQANTTSISGASTTGQVMVLGTGAVNITSVHVGFSTGASQTLSADATITINELVRYDFDAADLVNAARINFSPPRGSGRYIDVSCIGQKRSA